MIPSRLLKISMIGLSILMGTAFAAFSQTSKQSQSADSARTSLRYPVPMSQPQNLDEALQPAMADLKTPENLRTSVEYDVETGDYVLATYLGETRISTPLTIKQEEYSQYWVQKSNANFFKNKNKIDYSKKKDEFSLTDMQFDLGAAEKIFGPGGVQLRTQGAVEISFGVKNNIVENPSLSERARNRTYFDFDQSIQLSVNGKVGDKINVNMNYDTEASFDYDAKAIKLRYAGKEDEIIKSLEAGNVSMPVKNTLISGGTSLFGAKTELQFGKLNVAAVISQQNSQTTSASMEGGTQTTRFEIPIDAYDENRHFFLSHYFRDHYDQWMSKLPYISSGIVINKIEVWVTNKRARMDNARHIIAFADMAEPQRIFNDHWKQTGIDYPSNQTNTLYNELVSQYAGARQISESTAALAPLEAYGMQMGEDFERLESARLLQPNEYTLNKSLGYISLNQALNPDEILAVAFEYTKNGQVYQVGEFSTDGVEAPQALYVKLLKGTNLEPASPTWDLMMKNVYALGTYNMPEEDFRLNITYQNDTVGTYLNYLTEGKLKNQILLRVFRLDRLNTQDEAFPDGLFDFVNGYTTQGAYGRIIFPVVVLNIIRVGANKDDILAAYKARKKCYQFCKESAKRPDYKEYVETLQLDNFPNELKKAELGKKYLRQWWWISPIITFGLLLMPIFIPIMIIRMKNYQNIRIINHCHGYHYTLKQTTTQFKGIHLESVCGRCYTHKFKYLKCLVFSISLTNLLFCKNSFCYLITYFHNRT